MQILHTEKKYLNGAVTSIEITHDALPDWTQLESFRFIQ